MNKAITLEPNQVPACLKAGYSGRKFTAVVCESVTIPATAGLWGGGSRDTYRVVRYEDGASVAASDNMSAPWDSRKDRVVTLQPGFCVIEHSIFCGKDAGLRIYVHPQNAAAMLPGPVELTAAERFALNATGYKSSYAGKDRYQIACEEFYRGEKPTRAEYDAAKASLAARGLMTKAGAITAAGRNALRG